MTRRVYRSFRIAFGLFFFIPLLIIFVDFTGIIGDKIRPVFTALQFVPSVIKFITVPALLTSGFILITLLTLLYGRVYCSVFCPLGVLQDIAGYIRKRFSSRIKFLYTAPYNFLRYGLLLATVLSVLGGSMVLLNLLDPFSGFGRISFQLARPIIIGVNNIISFTLSRFGNYSVYPQEFYLGDTFVISFALVFFLTVVVMAALRGRLYCNTLCPVGSLLGLISKFSLFKFVIKNDLCTECGACGKVCKSECIDTESKDIDMSRCVVCFNCTSVCTSTAIILERNSTGTGDKYDPSRRFFVNKLGSIAPLLLTYAAVKDSILVYVLNKVPILKKNPVTPPGSVGREHFTSRCTACGLCVSACPTHVIQPSLFSYGLEGFLQPAMDYSRSFCNFECNQCTLVCPTGALLPVSLEQKKISQLGKAIFVKDNCVVVTQKSECGACSEHCPTKAVTMVPYEKLFLPEVRDKYCIGCGACEKACPTKPYKAIYVEGNFEHKIADKNRENRKEKKEEVLEEFPF